MTKTKTVGKNCIFSIAVSLLSMGQLVDIAPANQEIPVLTVEAIVSRMVQARLHNEEEFRPYTVRRDYRMFSKDEQDPKSQVIVDVSFNPPGAKDFAIRQTSGKGIGEKIVRKMLAGEVEIANKTNTDISPDNYKFRLLGEEIINDRQCYVLELTPLRKDPHLIEGKAWVDAETYLLHRTEGKPAKKPSWWVKNINFTLSYEDVGGMWLPTQLEATADVRLLGQYKMISHDVEYSFGDWAAVEPSKTKTPVRKYTRPRRDFRNSFAPN